MKKSVRIVTILLSLALLACSFVMMTFANDGDAAKENDPKYLADVYDADGNIVRTITRAIGQRKNNSPAASQELKTDEAADLIIGQPLLLYQHSSLF